MNGDDIINDNDTMPVFPTDREGRKMPLFNRIRCVLGYHKWETRQTGKGHRYSIETEEGKRRGIFGIHDETPLPLRDQCGRCHTLR